MASQRLRWAWALFPRPSPRSASQTASQCCSAPSRITTRALATPRAKRVPRKTSKETAKTKSKETEDASVLDPRLPSLNLASLRDAALLCGCTASGTKAAVRAGLEATMDEAPALDKSASIHRILSIDMGVRNLAYCLLQVDTGSAPLSRWRPVPKLMAWERLALIGGEKGASGGDDAQTATSPASAFTPPAMARVAARLVRDRLLPLAPTHVLVERQRFRSGGGAAVLEWTVRVNSLEAMLHGIFAYRQLDSTSAGDGNTVQAIHAVSPKRVSQYLLRGGLAGNGGSAAPSLPAKVTKEKDIKDVKEAFVAGILRSSGPGRLLTYDESITSIVDAYLLRWDAKQSKLRRKAKAAEADEDGPSSASKPVFSKIDDMADCVTQGLTWLEWEDNRTTLRDKGAETLLRSKIIAG